MNGARRTQTNAKGNCTSYRRLGDETHPVTGALLSSRIFTDPGKCGLPPIPEQDEHLESMFYQPLKVPEQGKLIQADYHYR